MSTKPATVDMLLPPPSCFHVVKSKTEELIQKRHGSL